MKKILLFLNIIILFSNCAVYKPDSGSLSDFDYDQRIEVKNAHFDRVLTPVGVGSFAVGTSAGGYLGYSLTQNSNYFVNYNGATKQNFAIAGGLVGAFTGYTLTYLLNKAIGWGDYKTPSNPNEWLKKANDNFLLARQTDNSNFLLIHKTAESNYLSKNIQDARDFVHVFPISNFTNEVVKQSGKVVARYEIPELINLYPDNINNLEIKYRYLSLSQNIGECVEAKNRFPEVIVAAETKSSGFITNLNDVKIFKSNFPESKYMNDVVNVAITNISIEELPEIVSLFPQSQYPNLGSILIAKKKYVDNHSSTISDYLRTTDLYSEIYDNKEIERKSSNLVKNISDATIFRNRFGENSEYRNSIFLTTLNSINRSDIKSLLNLYTNIDSTNIVQAKKTYLNKSTTIKQCLEAGYLFPELTIEADDKAFNMANSFSGLEDYNYYYPSGLHIIDAQEKYKTLFRNEYSNVNQNDELSLRNFIKKFNGRNDPENIVSTAIYQLKSITADMERKFDQMINTSDGYRLVQLVFDVPDDQVASSKLEYVAMRMKGMQSGWVDKDDLITGIQDKASKGTRGIIHGTWYRSGTTSGNSYAIISLNEGFASFQVNMKQELTNMGLKYVYCDYIGEFTDDEAKRQRNAEYDRQYEANQVVKKNYESSGNCWKDVGVSNADNTECSVSTTMYKATCVSYDGKEETKFYYYWHATQNKSTDNDCVFSYGQGYYQSRVGQDSYLGDDGETKALQELCGCNQK